MVLYSFILYFLDKTLISIGEVNPSQATGLFLYPLKTSENLLFLVMLSRGIERDQ